MYMTLHGREGGEMLGEMAKSAWEGGKFVLGRRVVKCVEGRRKVHGREVKLYWEGGW